jgi:predicted phosphodiesterase
LPVLTFGIVADVQYTDHEPVSSRYYRNSPDRLKEAVAEFKKEKVDFIINLGDLIDRDINSFVPVLEILEASGISTYHVVGNHDFSVRQREKKMIPVVPIEGLRYYSFVKQNYRFIFLDGNEVSLYGAPTAAKGREATELLAAMKSRGEINALEWNGAIGKDQLEWLKTELELAREKGEKVLAFCHFPLAPDNSHNLLNYKEVLSMLTEFPEIAVWFAGHNHEGNFGKTGNLYHLTFKAMVNTENENSYAIVRIFNNRIEITGYGREPDRILDL